MSSQHQTQLSLGNRIYLYNVLRTSIGIGRQTFITQVEDALAADGLTAENLGFENSRALMEELADFATLTIFKGGRIYVTLSAQEDWEEALDAAEAASAGGKSTGKASGKPWKRRKGSRAIKPVRPRTVEREESIPAPVEQAVEDAQDTGAPTEHHAPAAGSPFVEEPVPETDAEGAPAAGAPAAATVERPDGTPDITQTPAEEAKDAARAAGDVLVSEPMSATHAADALEATGTAPEPEPSPAPEAPEHDLDGADAGSKPDAGDSDPEATCAPTAPNPAAADREAPRVPAYSFTITFDPDDEDAGVTILESTPIDDTTAAVPEHAAVEQAASCADAASTADTPVSTIANSPVRGEAPSATDPYPGIDLNDYPTDFSTEVWCPAPLLGAIASLLPLGADALGIAGMYFDIACQRGTADLSRRQATFPLRYVRDGERREATVVLKRRSTGSKGASWTIDAVEVDG